MPNIWFQQIVTIFTLISSKAVFEQVKIMEEFVWINIFFFINLAFGQVDEKNEGKDCWDKKIVLLTDLISLSQKYLKKLMVNMGD
jgi:hypothetical protein